MGEQHESYGMIGASRISGTNRNLYGSSINHSNTISLRIKKGEKERDLNRNWYFGKELLIEVEMSQTQFAEMITSINMGDGIPCTIRHFSGYGEIEDPPEVSQRQIFEKEFSDDIRSVNELIKDDKNIIKELLLKKGGISIKERKEISDHIDKIIQAITRSIPFVQRSFNDAMDKTVNEAKGEVEAFTLNRILSFGIKGIEESLANTKGFKLLDGADDYSEDENV